MNYENIERALVDKIKNAFEEFERTNPMPAAPKGLTNKEVNAWKEEHIKPRSAALRAARGRSVHILSKVRKHRVWLNDRRIARDAINELRGELRQVRAAIKSGATLVAFDIERGWRALTTVEQNVENAKQLIVDDIVGFEIGHPIWITLPKPMTTRKERMSPPVVLRAEIVDVVADADNVSRRERGISGSIFIAQALTAAVGSEVSGKSATREIGITTFRNGKIESVNYRAENAKKTNWVCFAYGETQRLPLDEMLRRLSVALAGADYFVGHSLNVDISHLHEIGIFVPRRPVLDTFDFAALVPALNEKNLHGANLSTLAAYFGIECDQPHCGGNDARYNMELLLAMIEAHGTDHD